MRAGGGGGGGGGSLLLARGARSGDAASSAGMSRASAATTSAAAAAATSADSFSSHRKPEQHRGSFSEDQFLAVCREVGKPKTAADGPWRLVSESVGITIYRLYDEKSGLYKYRLYGVLADCSPEQCADVYMDLQYRKKWDPHVKEVCEKTLDGSPAIYWEMKFPFPLSNRDYVFTRERRDMEVDGKKICVILAKSVCTTKFPEKPGIIRVKAYKQSVAIETDGRNGSKVFMSYFDNPGGKLPTSVVNWAAKTGIPNFLKNMQKACLHYHKKR